MIPRALVALGLALVLGAANFAIQSREALLRTGHVVLLPLAPVDPRSLMQGDYMALDYQLARDIEAQAPPELRTGDPTHALRDGYAVLSQDADGVATLLRVQADLEPRAPGETALRYRVRDGRVQVGSNAWFFEEGSAERFEPAKFGEIKVAADGSSLLTGLRGEAKQPL